MITYGEEWPLQKKQEDKLLEPEMRMLRWRTGEITTSVDTYPRETSGKLTEKERS